MNIMKIALLGTAALAAVSVSARADDLSDLKAQIEALNGRISQLEATPSVPAGYQLLSISEANAIIVPGVEFDKSFGDKATNIGILPTADVPASTNIQWSGFVRAALVYKSTDYDSTGTVAAPLNDTSSLDVMSRAGIKVVGTTDTAVGEVGVSIVMIGNSGTAGGLNRGNPTVTTDGYWGYWKITPELTLGGGVAGSLAGNGQGFDGKCSCYYAGGDGSGGYGGHGDPSQIRLSYASGPISFAIAIEDEDETTGAALSNNKDHSLGVGGEFKYAGDTIGFELNAGWWDGETNTVTETDNTWTVNAGANMALGDIATLSIAAGVGEEAHINGNADRFTKGSVFLGFNLSDSMTAELGASYKNLKGSGDVMSIGAGLYYTPVSQLTIGLEAGYTDVKSSKESFDAALVTIYRF
jgi:hypothetical protein